MRLSQLIPNENEKLLEWMHSMHKAWAFQIVNDQIWQRKREGGGDMWRWHNSGYSVKWWQDARREYEEMNNDH